MQVTFLNIPEDFKVQPKLRITDLELGKQALLKVKVGNSLVVQWLKLCVSTAVGLGSNPGWATKIPQTL